MAAAGAGAGGPAAAGAGAPAAAGVDSDIPLMNKTINLLDPPKDLMVGNFLQDGKHGKDIRAMLTDLFSPGEPFPKDKKGNEIKGVGDTKPDLKKSIERSYGGWLEDKTNSILILRLKHSSGHDARPSGLYVAQDAGPIDVVANPTFLITPGSILDPAGKTKTGDVVNLVPIVGTLEKEPYIAQLSMSNVIDGNITMTSSADTYDIVIPSKTLGNIECSFNQTTFAPSGGSGKDYFLGNNTKNDYISKNITNTVECKKYILVKELGDTLQVQWLNKVFNTLPEYTNKNTVITTCDTVVWYRAITNKIPVIFTNPKGQTTYYSARIIDETQKATIAASFINTIRTEVISHNLSVIQTLKDVKDKLRVDGTKWINGLSWNDIQYTYAKNYLDEVVKKLENINKDFDTYFSLLANIEAAKELAARSHFINPFTYHKDGYYKTNNKVTYLLQNGSFIFVAKQFSPTNFNSPPRAVNSLFQIGGARKSLESLANEIDKINNKKVNITRSLDNLITDAFNNRSLLYVHTNFGPAVAKSNKEKNARPIEGNAVVFINDLWNDNTNRPGGVVGSYVGLDIVPYFVYCYVRDNHPDVFKYAAVVKEALASLGIDDSPYALVGYDLAERYPVEYFVEGQVKTGRIQVTQEPVPSAARESLIATIQALTLANFLVDNFQVLPTQNLANFFAFLKVNGVIQDIAPPVNVGDINLERILQSGGGDKNILYAIASEAMDIYEIYYSFAIEATYLEQPFPYDRFYRAIARDKNVPIKIPTIINAPRKIPRSMKRNLPPPARLVFGGKRFKKTMKRRNLKKKRRTYKK